MGCRGLVFAREPTACRTERVQAVLPKTKFRESLPCRFAKQFALSRNSELRHGSPFLGGVHSNARIQALTRPPGQGSAPTSSQSPPAQRPTKTPGIPEPPTAP